LPRPGPAILQIFKFRVASKRLLNVTFVAVDGLLPSMTSTSTRVEKEFGLTADFLMIMIGKGNRSDTEFCFEGNARLEKRAKIDLNG
jgi:hypothetical protein